MTSVMLLLLRRRLEYTCERSSLIIPPSVFFSVQNCLFLAHWVCDKYAFNQRHHIHITRLRPRWNVNKYLMVTRVHSFYPSPFSLHIVITDSEALTTWRIKVNGCQIDPRFNGQQKKKFHPDFKPKNKFHEATWKRRFYDKHDFVWQSSSGSLGFFVWDGVLRRGKKKENNSLVIFKYKSIESKMRFTISYCFALCESSRVVWLDWIVFTENRPGVSYL